MTVKVSSAMTRMTSLEQVDEFIRHWDTARRELPVATDGLVFKVDNLQQQLNLDFTAKSPRWAVAYKFPAERALTRLLSVSFDVGRTGVITPVANLDPVLLSGTVVKRASLHNEDIVRSLDIHVDDMVYVEKGGEIIPKITGVDVAKRLPGSEPLPFVTHCPVCGTPRPAPKLPLTWDCPACGAKGNSGKFCSECGAKRPEPAPAAWDCTCGEKGITGKFCPNCGKKRE